MRLLKPGQILIPYGSSRPPGDLLRTAPGAGGAVAVDCRMAHVVVDAAAAAPLRLNGGQYEAGFDIGGDERTVPDLLHEHLGRYCDMWRKAQRKFLDLYFDFVADEVSRNRDALARALAPFGDLYRPEDWIYSALRPLPQAFLSSAPGGAVGYAPENLVNVDFAFWDGARPVAIVLQPAGTADARRAAALAALRDAGTETVEIPAALLQDGGIGPFLPAALHRFWDGQPIPSGPFRPDLPDDLSAD